MGYKIEEARKKQGLTQNQLSEKSGISRTIISGLERGRISVTTTGTLKKIADALGVKIEDIFLRRKFNMLNNKRERRRKDG